MNNTMALLLSDTYKQCHSRMYPKGLTKLVSYWVPRRSMLENRNKMVFFGLQAFIKEYLMGYFQENFFDLTEDEMVSLYTDSMDIQIGKDNYDLDKIVQLHKLGYLPLEIRALSEGTLAPMGVPCIEITNTNDDFAWLVQWIECILQVNYGNLVAMQQSVICIVRLRIIGTIKQLMDCRETWLVRTLV